MKLYDHTVHQLILACSPHEPLELSRNLNGMFVDVGISLQEGAHLEPNGVTGDVFLIGVQIQSK